MIGPRVGPKVGERVGVAVGPGADPLAPSSSGAAQTTLTVTIVDSADPVITAANYTYAVVVTNTGAAEATNVIATVTLDAQLTYVSGVGTGWTADASAAPVITFTRAALAVGAAPTVTVTVTSPAAAETSSTTADADADNAPAATQDTETTVCNLVAKDATSGKRVPADSTQWTNFIAYHALSVAVPESLWLCQEASGNLADSIGALTLTASGSPTYQQAVTGWTRAGVGTRDAQTDRFSAAAAVGPNPTTTSQTWLAVILLPATPAATRTVWGITVSSGASACALRHLITTGLPRMNVVNVNVDGVASISSESHPFAVKYDRTNSAAVLYLDDEKVVGTYSTLVLDGNKGFGAQASAGSDAKMVYACMWSGANSEISDANMKALLQALGYTVPWS